MSKAIEAINGLISENQSKLAAYYAGREGISTDEAAVLRGEQRAYRRALDAIAAEPADVSIDSIDLQPEAIALPVAEAIDS